MLQKDIAVIALSGGLDSCVTAGLAAQKYDLALLHINYGQRTEERELKAFNDIAAYYNAKTLVIDFKHLAQIGGSSLTDLNLEVSEANLESKEIPSSYVPFRNGNILSACISWAEVLKAKAIYVGAVYEDSSGYPDCRPEFFSAFQSVLNIGTKPETSIIIETPVIHMSKKEIVEVGMKINAPLNLTWSCYQNEDEACGVCDSCALRLRGFQNAGIKDPIPYKNIINY